MKANYNNDIIDQLQKLHEAAINLKEKFDKNQTPEVIEAWTEIYIKELNILKEIAPEEVLSKGNLLRHSAWLYSNAKKHLPQNSLGDIKDICLTDIFLTQSYYFYYLTKTENPQEKIYEWHLIHPLVFKLAKSRFDNLQFADAVEASFKELNNIIKQRHKTSNSEELDGSSLMRKVFSTSVNNKYNPIFKLADNSTESGRNIQQGYMDIFSGAMQGIRNPKAHANIEISSDEAWEKIVIASHLLKMWEKLN